MRGKHGDEINALMSAYSYNFSKLSKALACTWIFILRAVHWRFLRAIQLAFGNN